MPLLSVSGHKNTIVNHIITVCYELFCPIWYESKADYLKIGVTLASLQKDAAKISDNEAAAQWPEARGVLFQSIHTRPKNLAA